MLAVMTNTLALILTYSKLFFEFYIRDFTIFMHSTQDGLTCPKVA